MFIFTILHNILRCLSFNFISTFSDTPYDFMFLTSIPVTTVSLASVRKSIYLHQLLLYPLILH